jgi:hypothetical protein
VVAEHDGWSLHAGVSMRAGDQDGRERLCRLVLRHALRLGAASPFSHSSIVCVVTLMRLATSAWESLAEVLASTSKLASQRASSFGS